MHLSALILSAALPCSILAQSALISALNANANLTSLATILQSSAAASLVAQFANSTSGTLLAPNNAALTAANISSSNLSNDTLNALSYHLLRGSFPASSIPLDHSVVRTYLPALLPANENQVAVFNKDPDGTIKIVQGLSNSTVLSNTTAGDFVVHQIDKVLGVPASLSATAGAAGLTSLATTLVTVLPGLIESLETIPGITVFAPINDAFADLPGLLSSIPSATIQNVLAHHVLNGTVVYSPSMKDQTLSITASGQPVHYINNATGLFIRSRESTVQVLLADVPIENGVVHLVSGILVDPYADSAALASAQAEESSENAQVSTATETGFVTESLDAAPSTFPSVSSATNANNAAASGVTSSAERVAATFGVCVLVLSMMLIA